MIRQQIRECDVSKVMAAEQFARESFLESYAAYQASASARAARGAPSLEDRTLNQFPAGDTDTWRITKVVYGSGAVEVRAVIGRTSFRKKQEKLDDGSTPVPCSPGLAGRLERSIRRSRKTLRSKCLQLSPDRMLTLTKRGKFANVDECWSAFKEFSRLMQKRFGDRWKYVCVPELHADGATYHMHCAVNGFFLAETVRVLWFRALGGKGNERGENTPGNVDLKFFKRGRSRNGYSRVRRIAGYVSKYIGKGFDEGNRGRRLFSSSSGLDPDRVERWTVSDWESIPKLAQSLQSDLVRSGGDQVADCYLWSRHRGDGSLLMTGFILSSELRVQ